MEIANRPDFWILTAPVEDPDAFVRQARGRIAFAIRTKTAEEWPQERYRVPVLRVVDLSDRQVYDAAISVALQHAAQVTGRAMLVDGRRGVISIGPQRRKVTVRVLRWMLN